MAMRHLRRIQEQAAKQQQPALVKDGSEEGEEEEGEELDEPSKTPFNPFDLLSDEDNATEGPNEDEEQQEQQDAGEDVAAPEKPLPTPTQPKPGGGGKKKKKKKGSKPQQKHQQLDDSSDENDLAGTSKQDVANADEDDIDRLVKELNLATVGASASASSAGTSSTTAASSSVLGVEMRALRGEEELRRIFGGDVVAAVDREERTAAAETRRQAAAVRGMGGAAAQRRRGLALKKGFLVAPKEHWPAWEGGLSMECVGSRNGLPLFKYVYSPAYRATQALFERCQASYDPNNIAGLLQQAPYHVDALLAMHDLYRHMGENSYAEEMLARALWVLEAAWHPQFSPAGAACRLDYSVDENKALFTALFRHAQALSRRGCHRAALEVCKLLLALEPEDPLGALCLVDYLAIRAGKYEWLRRFVLGFEANRSLALLPNYSYAMAMAAHMQQAGSSSSSSGGAKDRDSERAASGAAASSSGSAGGSGAGGGAEPSAQELLVGAILLHPLVVPRLVAALQAKGAAKEATWNTLLSRNLFGAASDGGSASLSHLVGLYVERSGQLWKPPDLLALLRSAASEAADVADGKAAAGGLGYADWRAVASESFPASASNEYRHLRLADFSDAVNALPREEMQAAIAGGGQMADVEDALAELQEALLAEAAGQGGGGQGQGGRGAAARPAMNEEQLRQANPLMMLLQTMLPWFNVGQQPEYGADDAAGQPRAQAAAVAGQPQLAAAAAAAAVAAAQQRVGRGLGAGLGQRRQQAPGRGQQQGQQQGGAELEFDENDGHLDDEDGTVRNVRQ